MKSRLVTIITLLLTVMMTASAANFATKRLQSIAQCINLQNLNSLTAQASQDGQTEAVSYDYQWQGHKLCVAANRYGEISHIGLALFPKEMKEAAPSPVYDFLERNLLERQLNNLDGELKHKISTEHVYFVVGNAHTVLSFNGTENFSEERVDLKSYRVTWTRNGREVLKISFDMDYELLSGCNSIELEQLFVSQLKRYKGITSTNEVDLFPENTNVFVVQGDSFLIREMRNDLYFERDASGWHLTDNPDATSKTLSNLMLSPQFRQNPSLQLTLDKYGYETEKVNVPYHTLLRKCIDDGCTPYFGIKEREDDGTYTGTVMFVNRRAGYVHMLSTRIPAETLVSKGEGTITGRLYVYIPMHNVSDRYFQQNKNTKSSTSKKKKKKEIIVEK